MEPLAEFLDNLALNIVRITACVVFSGLVAAAIVALFAVVMFFVGAFAGANVVPGYAALAGLLYLGVAVTVVQSGLPAKVFRFFGFE